MHAPQLKAPLAWDSVLKEADELMATARSGGFPASALVITGELPIDLVAKFRRYGTPNWDLPEQLRKPWILGTYQGIPILHVREAELPALYAADLERLGSLVVYPGTPHFEIRQFTEGEAQELLRGQPHLITDPALGTVPETARVRKLLQKVALRLFESVRFDFAPTGAPIQVVRLPVGGEA